VTNAENKFLQIKYVCIVTWKGIECPYRGFVMVAGEKKKRIGKTP
jgi:hypothetical protein